MSNYYTVALLKNKTLAVREVLVMERQYNHPLGYYQIVKCAVFSFMGVLRMLLRKPARLTDYNVLCNIITDGKRKKVTSNL